MSYVNRIKNELHLKIVYYGPGLGGKTTNIQYIYQKNGQQNSSELIRIDTENERTLFFDFLPFDLGKIRGFRTRLHLYTVPGQAFYEHSRKLLLRAVDGIIFVADSQVEKMADNQESFEDLKKNLSEQGMDYTKIPLVFQWNKRDLPNVAAVQDLNSKLNPQGRPQFEAVATKGEGVVESLKAITKHVIMNVEGGLS